MRTSLADEVVLIKVFKVAHEFWKLKVCFPLWQHTEPLTLWFSHDRGNLPSKQSLPHSRLLNRPDRQGHYADKKRQRGSVRLGVGSAETLKDQTDTEDHEDQRTRQSCIGLFSQRHLGKKTHILCLHTAKTINLKTGFSWTHPVLCNESHSNQVWRSSRGLSVHQLTAEYNEQETKDIWTKGPLWCGGDASNIRNVLRKCLGSNPTTTAQFWLNGAAGAKRPPKGARCLPKRRNIEIRTFQVLPLTHFVYLKNLKVPPQI